MTKLTIFRLLSTDVYEPRSGSCVNPSEPSEKSHILVSFRNLSTRYRNLEAAYNDMIVWVKLFYAMSYFTSQLTAEIPRGTVLNLYTLPKRQYYFNELFLSLYIINFQLCIPFSVSN